jgi:sec-independent protein translocase protein TatA
MEFPMHWLIILVVVLILFGGRKIPELMRGLARAFAVLKKACPAIRPKAILPQSASTEKPAEEKPQT